MVGESFASLHPSLRYESLYVPAGKEFAGDIFLHCDRFDEQKGTLRWTAKEVGGEVLSSGEEELTLSFGDRKKAATVTFTGTGKPIEVVLQFVCGSEIRENRYLFLTHNGAPDSAERRADIDAVVRYFDSVDEWALKK